MEHLPEGQAVLTGSPIRQELLKGNKLNALKFCGFTANKPVLMVIGGSQGSVIVNDAIRGILPELLKTFQVVHLCGAGKVDPTLNYLEGYVQFEYIKEELADLFAMADICVSRAGANADLRAPCPQKAQSSDSFIRQCKPRRPDSQCRIL